MSFDVWEENVLVGIEGGGGGGQPIPAARLRMARGPALPDLPLPHWLDAARPSA